MNTSAIIMFLIGAIMLWGGLAVCLTIALKNK
ncbi:MAG: methionine/alanine import family NSS transporter small subunit [Bacillota bacterium]|uniref:Methionine/alanine import family NSS transporter small subunit n=1 Tax=Thermanaerosceptrum fracticalcis TaxID=1712410 RepID=A0A7G6E625_THEFR|nr:methionine/alanine import family NSS transporter small subunit [Thermanaerosceptrum fracticalcis]QNB47529.1 methionine/alanine import family NSS transporter small subunit [Thermanaerosceptrum fracticalcis]